METPVTITEVYSLLTDVSSQVAEVFKISLDFFKQEPNVYRGTEKLGVEDAVNRVFQQ